MHNRILNRLIATAVSLLVSQTVVADSQEERESVAPTAGFADSEMPVISVSLDEDGPGDVIPTPTRSASEDPPRIGFTDAEYIMTLLPEYEAFLQGLQRKYDSNFEIVQARRAEFQALFDSYEAERPMLSEETRADRERKILRGQEELKNLEREMDAGLEQERVEKLKPVRKLVQDAIDEVAEEKGLEIVVRKSAVLYVDSRKVINISLDLAAKLGITEAETTDQEGN